MPDSRYVTVNADGHLECEGKRMRYWSTTGRIFHSRGKDAAPAPPETIRDEVAAIRQANDATIARIRYLGFNSVRLWEGIRGQNDYTTGDGSYADCLDYWLGKVGEAGLKVWMAGFNRLPGATPEDVDIIDDPATAAGWKAAVAEAMADNRNRPMKLSKCVVRVWDPRIEAICMASMVSMATHYNKYTGLRWCDDPTIGVWELSNEEWWVRRMLSGDWLKYPAFFRRSLLMKWNGYLRDRYETDAALSEAWGKLLPGESLSENTVLLAPLARPTKPGDIAIPDANEKALAALESIDEALSGEDFPEARGSDVLRFLTGMIVAHKQREAKVIKALGKGTRLCPMIYDTGIGYQIQAQYLHMQADAIAHDSYLNGVARVREHAGPPIDELQRLQWEMGNESTAPGRGATGRWNYGLKKHPGICQGVPWLEHNKVEGKPFFVYETQIQQPAKYRVDFPMRIAAAACIQDWDWICWFYWECPTDIATNRDAFVRPMDVTVGGHPQGYHYTYDEVQSALMYTAGQAWVNGHLKPAPNPTVFVYGRQSLYDPRSMTYGGSYGMTGMDMLPTTYQYGTRIRIDPTREGDEVIGPVVKFQDRHTHNPYAPTKQITFDHKVGYLKFDSPSCAGFTGKLVDLPEPVVRFANGSGVTLSEVRIHNPDGSYDPVGPDEMYFAFMLTSGDGKPLAETTSATLAIQSTSYNTGFRLKDKARDVERTVQGTTPVLVSRVAAKVESSALDGMTYTFLDWSGRVVEDGTVKGGVLTVPNDKPIFLVKLTRSE